MSNKKFRLNDSVEIPAVGFGTFLIEPGDTAAAVEAAIKIGYRHIDTAAVYGNEAEVGRGVRAGLAATGLDRKDLFVTTKLWPGMPEHGDPAKTPEQTEAAFHHSLNLLGLDHVDLYLIHSPHGADQRIAQWRTLLSLKDKGLARAVGVSNFNVNHLEEIAAAGLRAPDANQIELHPWSQKPELVAYMRRAGIAPSAYSSLAPLSTWRTGQTSAKTSQMVSDGAVFAELAKKYGVTEAQFLLGWGVQNGYAVLPKSLNADRMRQNLNLDGFVIDQADLASIRTMDRGAGIAWEIGDPIQQS